MNRYKLVLFLTVAFVLLVILAWHIPNNAFARINTTSPQQSTSQVPASSQKIFFPMICKNCVPPPTPTTSRYVVTTDWNKLWNQGCSQGTKGGTGIAVLNFGYPVRNAATGLYGTILLSASHPFVSIDAIESLAAEFLQGYWECAPANSFLVVALGVNNSNLYGGVTSGHGQAWGQMVDYMVGVINWGPPYLSDKVDVAGAVDIEFAWTTATVTRAWVDAYQPTYQKPLYDFGTCDSCPYFEHPEWTPVGYGWTFEDVWYVSWGAGLAYPLPEIYQRNGQHADQWYRRSLYAYSNHGVRMYFSGAFTQWAACQGQTLPAILCRTNHLDNAPSDGWRQLYYKLSADSRTAQSLLEWSTDITWAEQ